MAAADGWAAEDDPWLDDEAADDLPVAAAAGKAAAGPPTAEAVSDGRGARVPCCKRARAPVSCDKRLRLCACGCVCSRTRDARVIRLRRRRVQGWVLATALLQRTREHRKTATSPSSPPWPQRCARWGRMAAAAALRVARRARSRPRTGRTPAVPPLCGGSKPDGPAAASRARPTLPRVVPPPPPARSLTAPMTTTLPFSARWLHSRRHRQHLWRLGLRRR